MFARCLFNLRAKPSSIEGKTLITMKKNSFTAWLLFCSTLVLTGCQSMDTPPQPAAQLPLTSRIIDAQTGKTLTPDALLAVLSRAPTAIVGEEHTNADHHAIELWLLQNMVKKRPQGSVLLEMLTPDQQPAVDRVKLALHDGAAMREPRIQEALRWNAGWPWPLYGALVMTALKADYPLLAANITRERIGEIYQNPVFPAGEYSSQKTVRDAQASIIYLMHGGDIQAAQIQAMVAIQQNRDRAMAQALIDAPRPAVLFAGGYHAAKDIGVPVHIQDLNGSAPVVLMLATEGTTITAKQADYVWFVPASKP